MIDTWEELGGDPCSKGMAGGTGLAKCSAQLVSDVSANYANIDSKISSPEITIQTTESLALIFNSSWKKSNQSGKVTVKFDGKTESDLLILDASKKTDLDETIYVNLKNPSEAKKMVINWYFEQIDSIEIQLDLNEIVHEEIARIGFLHAPY